MKDEKVEISLEDAIKFSNQNEFLYKRRANGILLNDYQINVLNKNGFDYLKYGNIHDLLFDIEEELNIDYDEELDLVSSQIAEYIYYNETKKWDNFYLSHFIFRVFLFGYML